VADAWGSDRSPQTAKIEEGGLLTDEFCRALWAQNLKDELVRQLGQDPDDLMLSTTRERQGVYDAILRRITPN
jgi:hypothetical protein